MSISSIGGEIALPLSAWYHASKHALEGYSDSLGQEAARSGVRASSPRPRPGRATPSAGSPR
ncbi:SDR family NAD(P)-dependent oxidoreductase [Nonomuraea composti]|uniref:SDR family NAD(P)-dependent oxidoreductase n=1 Tax=Nonomuraea composti TaxID=2720023 RepID=UPI003204CDA6